MQKGKTLSFILASLLSLSQIAPGMAISQKAYASTDKVEKEITSKIDHNLEDGNQNKDKIDVDTILRIELPEENTYPKGKGQYTKWIFTLKNNSDKSVYLGGISTPASANDSSDMISKNINIETFEVKTHELYKNKYLKNFFLDVFFKNANKVEGEKRGRHLGSNISFYPNKVIYANFKFHKTLEIPAQKSIDIEIWTLFFDKDYLNPFDKEKWMRTEGNDNTCLFNTDHAMSLKANLYYDRAGENPINQETLPEGSKLNDQASGSFQLEAKVGDLSFGNESKKPSEVLIKKSGGDKYNSTGKAEANTNDTLRFVVPTKISDANKAYQEALKKAGHNQYLINPRFLFEREDDDSGLDQEFYIRKTADDSLIKLKKTEVTEDEKKYYKLTLPDGVTDFMEDFDFVYDVTFKDENRTHGLVKKVKLDFDNLGKVIDTKGDLTIDLRADYLNAREEYQVDFDMDGHGVIKSQSVKKGQTASEPKKPEADGYLFEGWYSDKELTKEFDFTKPITENTTIYAKWAKLFDITYEFVSETAGKSLPDSIKKKLTDLVPKKEKEGKKIKAPKQTFDSEKVQDGTWTFAGWDKDQLEVSEDNNKFTGKWTFIKKEEEPSGPKPGDKDPKDNDENQNQPPKPGEGTGGNTDGKGGEHPDNPKDPEPDKNKDKDKKDGGKDKPSSGDKDKKDSDKKDPDRKPSLKPADAPKEKVIRVNTDIYRPIPKGYKRVYFDPGKDACLKYNPSFDYGEVIAFDVKETMTFGEAKAEDKGLVIPIAIPKDKSLKFAGWSPKLQADGEFVEGVKYVALYEKIDKDQETSNIKKSDKNPSKKGQDLVKAEDNKDKKNEKLISDGEISKKENAKAQNSLANKAKAQINKYTSPRTGVAGLGLVTGILVLSSAGLFLSKKFK